MPHSMRLVGFSVCILALASCGPLPVYYQEGYDQTRVNSDTTACQVKALNDAPVATEIRQRPPIYQPPIQHCHAGNCWVRPGYWVDGGTYTVDVNEALRGRVEQECMARKGYQRLDLPRCSQDQITALSSQRAGGLGEASCALRQKDGNTIILPPL